MAMGQWSSFPDASDAFVVNPNAMLVTESHVYAGTLDRGLYFYDRRIGRWTVIHAGLPSLQRDGAGGARRLHIYRYRQRPSAHSGAESGEPMKPLLQLFLPLVALCALARADAGILIAGGHDRPDNSILSLAEMEIDVRIDNGDARVAIRQIFDNHTAAMSEGTYVFALPGAGDRLRFCCLG